MNLIPILAAAQKTAVADTVPHLMGMLLVLVTLACLWGVCALSATVIRMLAPAPAAPPPVAVRAAVPPVAAPDGLTPEIIAVISAAIASVTDSSHRIVAIRRHSSTWEKAGRQSVLSSHKIR